MSAWREVKDWCMQTKWHHHPGRCTVAQHADLSKPKSGQRGEKGDVYGVGDRGPIYTTHRHTVVICVALIDGILQAAPLGASTEE